LTGKATASHILRLFDFQRIARCKRARRNGFVVIVSDGSTALRRDPLGEAAIRTGIEDEDICDRSIADGGRMRMAVREKTIGVLRNGAAQIQLGRRKVHVQGRREPLQRDRSMPGSMLEKENGQRGGRRLLSPVSG
jgi:hypothetical protein